MIIYLKEKFRLEFLFFMSHFMSGIVILCCKIKVYLLKSICNLMNY